MAGTALADDDGVQPAYRMPSATEVPESMRSTHRSRRARPRGQCHPRLYAVRGADPQQRGAGAHGETPLVERPGVRRAVVRRQGRPSRFSGRS